MPPAEGEGPRHDRQVGDRHEHRALAEVRFDDRVRVAVDDVVGTQQVRQRAIALARRRLRRADRLVDLERPPGEPGQDRDDPVGALPGGPAGNQARRRDGARIDEGVGGATGALLETDRVERLAARLDADVLQHLVTAELVEGEREHEGLGDGLDREQGVVAERHRRAPRIDHGHGEPLGIGRGELGDVLGRRSAVLPAHLVEHGTEHLAHWIHALDPSGAPVPRVDHRGSAAPGARRVR